MNINYGEEIDSSEQELTKFDKIKIRIHSPDIFVYLRKYYGLDASKLLESFCLDKN